MPVLGGGENHRDIKLYILIKLKMALSTSLSKAGSFISLPEVSST
jgi:hypothetical protein